MSQSSDSNHDLDVCVLFPIKRHEFLLKIFKELPINESIIINNNHDPLPLFFEFCSMHGDEVQWKYLNKGGRDCKLKVTRTEDSQGREFTAISTLMELRKVDKKD